MLRTIFVLILMVVGLAYSVRGAFYVLLFYLWFAYFRPESWIWFNFVSKGNLSFVVGVAVLVTTLFSRERFRLGFGPILMFAFLAHSAISIFLSPVGTFLWADWIDFARKVTIGYMLVVLVSTEQRLRLALLVIAFSLSFEGAKQGWVTLIIAPGATNENPSPFLGDNNGVGVGMLMLVPILAALARTSSHRLEKYTDRFLIVGVLYRAISTYSRGSFLASLALGVHYLARAKRKFVAIVGVAILVAVIAPALPDAFWERMGSIQTAAEATNESELDVSQASRLHFWKVAQAMADDRPLYGVGFGGYNVMYDRYDFRHGDFGGKRSVHSAWFGILGELGYVGLSLFLLLIGRAFYINWKARRLAKARPDLANIVIYGTALEASLVAFAVGGAFVPFQYNEMLWHFLALSMVIDRLIHDRLAPGTEAIPSPAVAVTASASRFRGAAAVKRA